MGLFTWLLGRKDTDTADKAVVSPPSRKNEAAEEDEGCQWHEWLKRPDTKCGAHLIAEDPGELPEGKGLYAWYFWPDDLPVPVLPYIDLDGFKLMYIGIAPQDQNSKSTLRSRIRGDHIRGNAYGSSLRLSLGVLLQDQLNLKLMPYGEKGFIWSNEDALSEWIQQNAVVAWTVQEQPWKAESLVVRTFGTILPLNYEYNEKNKFAQQLHENKRALKKAISR